MEFLELVSEDFSRVNGGTRHDFLLMIVDDFNIRRPSGGGGPFEAKSPLAIEADRVLPVPVASQRLQPIAGQCREVGQRRRGVQDLEALPGLPRESPERPHELAMGKLARASVPVA